MNLRLSFFFVFFALDTKKYIRHSRVCVFHPYSVLVIFAIREGPIDSLLHFVLFNCVYVEASAPNIIPL